MIGRLLLGTALAVLAPLAAAADATAR